jgi:hypothetical protein
MVLNRGSVPESNLRGVIVKMDEPDRLCSAWVQENPGIYPGQQRDFEGRSPAGFFNGW